MVDDKHNASDEQEWNEVTMPAILRGECWNAATKAKIDVGFRALRGMENLRSAYYLGAESANLQGAIPCPWTKGDMRHQAFKIGYIFARELWKIKPDVPTPPDLPPAGEYICNIEEVLYDPTRRTVKLGVPFTKIIFSSPNCPLPIVMTELGNQYVIWKHLRETGKLAHIRVKHVEQPVMGTVHYSVSLVQIV